MNFKMIKLILKDIRANKNILLFRIIIPMLIGGFFFTFPYLGWESYFMLACMVTIISGSAFYIWEKRKNIEMLTCSLPVSRNTVVYSRYLISLFFGISGLVIWGLNAWFADMTWEESATQFGNLFNLKILFMALFMMSVHFSIYLPSAFYFRHVGMILFIAISIMLSIVLTATFFIPDNGILNPNLEAEKAWLYIVLLAVMIILPWISIQISKYIFNKKDLE